MISRYNALIKQLSTNEPIKVISAEKLTSARQKLVEEALTMRVGNTDYTVEYEVDEAIIGGLQVYFGNSFLDCSLSARLNRVQNEVDGLSL